MNVAITPHWQRIIRRMIKSGRFSDANEVVNAGLRKLQEAETSGEYYPPGSLQHLYTGETNARETALARTIRVPTPEEA